MRIITDFTEIYQKTVIVRVDYNVPMKDGKISDNTRIVYTIPTLQYLIKNKCKIILLSHLGRPGGYEAALSLRPLVEHLQEFVKTKVIFSTLENSNEKLSQTSYGEILLLENIRFYPEEMQNDLGFAKRLSKLADIYVNEAFSCSHRQHASIAVLSKLLPSAAGVGLAKEVQMLRSIFDHSCGPVAAIIGGAKISTKAKLIRSLAPTVDHVIVGGALANNLLLATGFNIGKSLCEENITDSFVECENIILPQDAITAKSIADETHVCDIRYIPTTEKIFDLGPASILKIKNILESCKTVLWNGPLGLFEEEKFSRSTAEVAKTIAHLTKHNKLRSIIGGGDSICAINKIGINHNDFTYISTAGGAFLEWIEQRNLPALSILSK